MATLQIIFDGLLNLARRLGPGLAVCLGVAALAQGAEMAQIQLFASVPVDGRICAIVLGAALRTGLRPSDRVLPGISFAGRGLLEAGVVLMGAGLQLTNLRGLDLTLVVGILAVVLVSVGLGIAVCRLAGTSARLGILIACGNSICGNSAIAAVAPVIGADNKDTTAAIAVTAMFGLLGVFVLPLVGHGLALNPHDYGLLTGLTVYSVPQVVAASVPLGPVAVQVATFVKLVRIVMLAPVAILMSLICQPVAADGTKRPVKLQVPLFIVGYFVCVALRAGDVLAPSVVAAMTHAATLFTLLAMAALGLSVDLRDLLKSGPRLALATFVSLLVLAAASALLMSLVRA